MEPLYSPQSRAERLISGGRVALAASSLFAIWLDPSEPAKYARIAYSLLGFYVVYSLTIAALIWRSDAPSNQQRLITHCFDLVFFSLFIYFTAGPASPFTAYFVFSLVCATLRWQWWGTLWTALASLAAFLGVGLYFTVVVADPDFQIYSLIVRGVYLTVTAVLLGYLGAHEDQTRRDMARVAAWPQAEPQRIEPLVRNLLEHAAQALGTPRTLLAWVEREEPWLYLASWAGGSLTWSRASPEPFSRLVAEPLQDSSFLCPNAADPRCTVLRKSTDGLARWRGSPLDSEIRERFDMQAVLSVPIDGESIEGRLFFIGKSSMTSDDLVLGEIVAGVMAARLDHFYLNQRLQESVATEERIRLARDLHDGVLQSLTGIGLRLAAVRGMLEENPKAARDSLEVLQGLIAREQRDLRFFIQELKPPPLAAAGEGSSLAGSVPSPASGAGPDMPIRLVLADDHPIVLDGLEQLFRLEQDFSVVARCRDGEETLRALRAFQPDVLVLDIRMPRCDGLQVLRALQNENLPTRVVLLTAALQEDHLVEALQLGVGGIVLKEMAPRLLVDAVREVHSGGRWLDKSSSNRALERLLRRDAEGREAAPSLTPREIEIVRMVARGLRNRSIAEQLFISEGTVKIHLHNIYQKLEVSGRLELAVHARSKGLV